MRKSKTKKLTMQSNFHHRVDLGSSSVHRVFLYLTQVGSFKKKNI